MQHCFNEKISLYVKDFEELKVDNHQARVHIQSEFPLITQTKFCLFGEDASAADKEKKLDQIFFKSNLKNRSIKDRLLLHFSYNMLAILTLLNQHEICINCLMLNCDLTM